MSRTITLLFDKQIIAKQKAGKEWDFVKNGYAQDIYSDKYYPINFDTNLCYFDYHLPLHLLIKKYNPAVSIEFKSIETLKKNESFIYNIHFKAFHSYFKSNSFVELINQLHPTIKDGVLNGNGIIILNDSHEYANYLNLYNQLKPNNHFSSKVLITSSNLDNQNYVGSSSSFQSLVKNKLVKLYSEITKAKSLSIFGFRYFEEAVAMQTNIFYNNYSFDKRLEWLANGKFKTLLCLNNVNKDFRTIISYLIYKNNLQSHFYVSHKQEHSLNEENAKAKWKPLVEVESFKKFESKLPLKADNFSKHINNPWNIIPWELVNNSFAWLVTETIYDGSGLSRCFFTEKTYKPISLFMPFIIIGQPNSLKNLKAEGYQTFSNWWDESYDSEVNSVKRMTKIIELVKLLCSKSQKQLLVMFNEMRPILEHNHNKLLNSQAAKPFISNLLDQYYA